MKFLFLSFMLLSNLIAKDILIVSIPAQKYFVEQVVKDKFIIKVMMYDNINPQNYEPTAQQFIWTESAKAYLRLGIYDEGKWIKRIRYKNETLQTFDTTKNIKINPIDPHIWLDPILVKTQIKNIYKIVSKLDPQNSDFYKKNYLKFVNKISRIDYQLKALFAKNKRNHFIVFHPAWGYFAKRYKLKQLIIDSNPILANKEETMYILNQVNKFSSNILFISKYYFPPKLLQQIKNTTKIHIIPISPIAYDWENNLINMARNIVSKQMEN